jgi:hypothetical protein
MPEEPVCVRSVRFPPLMHEKIMQIAKERERSFNWMVVRLMEERLKEYQEEDQQVKNA